MRGSRASESLPWLRGVCGGVRSCTVRTDPESLAKAGPEIQRQVFEAFELQITYDKVGRRIEISATVSTTIADAFENAKALQKEGSVVVARDIAGAGFVLCHHPRIVERVWAAA